MLKASQINRNKKAFTILELMMTVGLMTIVMGAAMSGWIYVMFAERSNSVQNELDIDVRNAMEFLRRDLRLSAMENVVFYPDGPGPYSAISFPKARDDDGDGLIELDGDGKIIWDQTIVYHVWESTPNELRITTFDPRDNTLTSGERAVQLGSVVTNGTGSSAENGANAETFKLFANLFDWELWSGDAVFDGYSPVVEREVDLVLGSVLIGSGTHDVRFECIGKNPSSSGFELGVDVLHCSASASPREGEWQLPVAAESGATAVSEFMNDGKWSGNNQLSFPATGPGDYVTLGIPNDRWEATNFGGAGEQSDDTEVEFYDWMSPPDYVVELEGWEWTWDVYDQTENWWGSWSMTAGDLNGYAVRQIVKANQLVTSGGNPWVYFVAPNANFGIRAAYIAELDTVSTNLTMNTTTNYRQLVFNDPNGPTSIAMNAWDTAWATPEEGEYFPIDATKSYAISFLVSTAPGHGNVVNWTSQVNDTESFLIPDTLNPTSQDLVDTTWTAKAGVIETNVAYGMDGLFTVYVPTGYYVSAVFDTHMDSPVYDWADWWADVCCGAEFSIKFRTGTDSMMSDAPDWSNVTVQASAGPITLPAERYVQYKAILESSDWGFDSPRLHDMFLEWDGATRIVDFGLTHTRGPDYGMYAVTVDDKPLSKAIIASIEIYETVSTFSGGDKLLTSFITQEIEPRNTGK